MSDDNGGSPPTKDEILAIQDMAIHTLVYFSHATALEKGWWNDVPERPVSDVLINLHAEVSEAWEEYREGYTLAEVRYHFGGSKPLGIPIELADIVIRIADFCGRHGIDLEDALKKKMAYNTTRPYRHGGKRA